MATVAAVMEAAPANPAPVTPSAFRSEIAASLSPSAVATFTDCPARYWFRYGLGLPDPKTGAQALGIAVHETIAWALEQKMKNGRNVELIDAMEQFAVELPQALGEAELTSETPADLAEVGFKLVDLYVKRALPGVDPAGVEVPVSGVIGGVPVRGVVDVIERNGTIRDTKTKARKTRCLSHGELFQVATYKALIEQTRSRGVVLPKPSGAVQVDSLVKTKTPQLTQIGYMVSSRDALATERIYPLVQDAARAGYFVPNRGSNMCSRKNCAYAAACCEEYGGQVL